MRIQKTLAVITVGAILASAQLGAQDPPPAGTPAPQQPEAQAPAPAASSDPLPTIEKQTFKVTLSNAVGSTSSKANDPITGVVLEPQDYAGWEAVGAVTAVKPAKRGGKGGAELQFHFDKLVKGETVVPVTADVIEVANSKGIKGVDEEGNVIGTTSNAKKKGALAGALGGGLLGAMKGGVGGAAIGAAAGAVAGYFIVKMTTKGGSDIRFEKGANFTLQVSTKGKNKKE